MRCVLVSCRNVNSCQIGLTEYPSSSLLTQSFSELIVAQNCELITLWCPSFLLLLLVYSHAVTFPYFSLLVPSLYCVLILSLSHLAAFTHCHFLTSPAGRTHTILPLGTFPVSLPLLNHEYIYLARSRLTSAVSY